MTAIEYRDRQKIQHPETDADDGQKQHKLLHAHLGGVAGVLGNRDGAADIARRHLELQHPVKHLERKHRHRPGITRALGQRLGDTEAHLDAHRVGDVREPGADIDTPDRLPVLFHGVRGDFKIVSRAFPFHRDVDCLARALADRLHQPFPRWHRLAIDLHQTVADFHPGTCSRTRFHGADHRQRFGEKTDQSDAPLQQRCVDFLCREVR